MAKGSSVLQQRVLARLDDLRRSPRDVSLKAGLGPDAIRTILSGRSKSPRGETLTALADELQCDVGYLLGTIATPHASEDLRTNEFGTMRGVRKMVVIGSIRGSWGPIESTYKEGEWPTTDVFSLPQYLPGFQSLERVIDNSADLIATPGSYLHVLGIGTNSSIDVKDKDVIVMEQQRIATSGKGEIRRACWEVRRYRDDLIVLRLATTIRAYQEELTLEGKLLKLLTGEGVIHDEIAHSIDSLVLRVITPMAGPPIEHEPEENITHPD